MNYVDLDEKLQVQFLISLGIEVDAFYIFNTALIIGKYFLNRKSNTVGYKTDSYIINNYNFESPLWGHEFLSYKDMVEIRDIIQKTNHSDEVKAAYLVCYWHFYKEIFNNKITIFINDKGSFSGESLYIFAINDSQYLNTYVIHKNYINYVCGPTGKNRDILDFSFIKESSENDIDNINCLITQICDTEYENDKDYFRYSNFKKLKISDINIIYKINFRYIEVVTFTTYCITLKIIKEIFSSENLPKLRSINFVVNIFPDDYELLEITNYVKEYKLEKRDFNFSINLYKNAKNPRSYCL